MSALLNALQIARRLRKRLVVPASTPGVATLVLGGILLMPHISFAEPAAPGIPSASPPTILPAPAAMAAPAAPALAGPLKANASSPPHLSTPKRGQAGAKTVKLSTVAGHTTVSGGALNSGYAALIEGRFDIAADAYLRALIQNGEERDALLGLAYIAHHQGRLKEARTYYQRVLLQDPENPNAHAGLLAIPAEGHPPAALNRAREIAEKNPESASILSALGSLLAREGQLAEAQQAFFRAAALEPEYAQHAYNLAVALDRLHKPDVAINYYLRAVALSDKSSVRQSFLREAALQRLEQLRASSRQD